MFVFANRSKSVVDVLIDAYRLYRDTFKYAWYWSFGLILISTIPQINRALSAQKLTFTEWGPALVQLLFLIMLLLISAYFTIMLMLSIFNAVTDRLPVKECVKKANEKWWTVSIAMILISLLALLGLMLFVLPGIIISLFVLFYLPLILFENDGIVDSILKSCQLVWGNVWQIFLAMLVPVVIMVSGLFFIRKFVDGDMIAFILVRIIYMTFFMPFLSAMVLVLFNDVKLRRNLGMIRFKS